MIKFYNKVRKHKTRIKHELGTELNPTSVSAHATIFGHIALSESIQRFVSDHEDFEDDIRSFTGSQCSSFRRKSLMLTRCPPTPNTSLTALFCTR